MCIHIWINPAFPKPGPEFPMSYLVDFFVFSEVIVRFVDIGGIVDHHCLNFLLFC